MKKAVEGFAGAIFLTALFIISWFAVGALFGFAVRGFRWAAGV